jgi:hypothetical protein
VYRARHDPSQVGAAIFSRASKVMKAKTLGSFAEASLAPLLAKFLDTYDFGII